MADSEERSSIGGRLRRYAQVTGTMSGLAARLAGERYLGIELDRGKHANQLREALGSLKGPLMKVAQILSTIPDALPKEYAEELAALQADAEECSATRLGKDVFKDQNGENVHEKALGLCR